MDRGTVYGLSTLAAGSKPITYLSVKEADHHHLADHRHHHVSNLFGWIFVILGKLNQRIDL